MVTQTNSPKEKVYSDKDLITRLRVCTETERNQILVILYDRYKQLTLKVCYHYLSDYELAQDVFHDVFIKVIESAHTLKNPAVFKSWLLTITRNICIDRLRNISFKNVHELDPNFVKLADDTLEGRYIAKMEKKRMLKYLSNCIENFDPSLVTILKLRTRGLNAPEISKLLGMTRNELRRAYRKMRIILESTMRKRGINIKINKIIGFIENYGTF